MNLDELYPSKYLKATDLNTPLTSAIDRVAIEVVGRARERKVVLYVQGHEKGLILNKTNSAKIATLTGARDTDNWPGHVIQLFATTCDFGGEDVECIRIRPAPTTRKSAPPPAIVEPAEPTSDLTDVGF